MTCTKMAIKIISTDQHFSFVIYAVDMVVRIEIAFLFDAVIEHYIFVSDRIYIMRRC